MSENFVTPFDDALPNPRPQALAPSVKELDDPKGAHQTSLNSTIQAEAEILFRAFERADYELDEVANQPLHLVHFLAYDCPFQGRDSGEWIMGVRTVLVTEDGKTIGSMSNGIFRSLKRLLGFISMAPWKPPLPVVVKAVPLKNGNRTYTLEYHPELRKEGGKKK